jgi:hypothetical protein
VELTTAADVCIEKKRKSEPFIAAALIASGTAGNVDRQLR